MRWKRDRGGVLSGERRSTPTCSLLCLVAADLAAAVHGPSRCPPCAAYYASGGRPSALWSPTLQRMLSRLSRPNCCPGLSLSPLATAMREARPRPPRPAAPVAQRTWPCVPKLLPGGRFLKGTAPRDCSGPRCFGCVARATTPSPLLPSARKSGSHKTRLSPRLSCARHPITPCRGPLIKYKV